MHAQPEAQSVPAQSASCAYESVFEICCILVPNTCIYQSLSSTRVSCTQAHAPATLHAGSLRLCGVGSTRLIVPVVAVLVVVAGWHHAIDARGSLVRDPANQHQPRLLCVCRRRLLSTRRRRGAVRGSGRAPTPQRHAVCGGLGRCCAFHRHRRRGALRRHVSGFAVTCNLNSGI